MASKRAKVFTEIPLEKAKRIADISADLVDFDSTIAEITKVILCTDVNKDVKTMLCVFQEKKTKAEPLEKMELPPLMLPPQLAQNPAAAAQYLRQVVESDQKALQDGKIPDIIETLNHCHFELDESVGFKMLCVIRDHYQEKKVELSRELQNLLKPAKNGVS